jgi:hypothetical protein
MFVASISIPFGSRTMIGAVAGGIVTDARTRETLVSFTGLPASRHLHQYNLFGEKP